MIEFLNGFDSQRKNKNHQPALNSRQRHRLFRRPDFAFHRRNKTADKTFENPPQGPFFQKRPFENRFQKKTSPGLSEKRRPEKIRFNHQRTGA